MKFENDFEILLLIAIVSFLAILVEFIWSRVKRKNIYNLKETGANLFIVIGMQISKYLFFGWQYYCFTLAYDLTNFRIQNSVASYIILFIAIDFSYYWYHRIMHEVKFFWTFHLVHHSSPWMNFTTSFRLNWFSPLVAPLFFIPVVLIGFDPKLVAPILVINLSYQFWLHTEAIGKIPFIEGILNTPSAHRVHHGSNEKYLDKNYGGVLMIWDRIFGTYQKEEEKVIYGITTGFVSHNPFKLIFHGFIDYFNLIVNQLKIKIRAINLMLHPVKEYSLVYNENLSKRQRTYSSFVKHK